MASTDGQTPRPIVVSGPSGSGKSTLTNRLLEAHPEKFGFSVSHTTRAPRGQERHGKEYYFVTKDEFETVVEENGFIEHARFGTNFYGTSFAAVQNVASQGRTCILDIEMEGVKQVKNSPLNARFLFVQPPSEDVLEQRLRGRGTDSEDAIGQRLRQAKKELEYAKTPGVHDLIIINDDLEKAWEQFHEFCLPDSA